MAATFYDENSVRWTVVPHPVARADDPGRTSLLFTSASGERRRCDACLPDGATWDDVDERVWRALLRHSEVIPSADG